MENIFFNNWDSLFRTLIIGVCSYLILILMLRVIGNKTLSQLNAFDLIVTVALGSTLATVILNKSVALADGVLALFLLIILQFFISRLAKKSDVVEKVIKTEPRLLYFQGSYLKEAMDESRVTRDEVLQVIRSKGIGDPKEVDAVVLETNGKFSVIKKLKDEEKVLQNVKRNEE